MIELVQEVVKTVALGVLLTLVVLAIAAFMARVTIWNANAGALLFFAPFVIIFGIAARDILR